jgi:mono/diheme cytochrome c family protein/chitodextrinase
VTLDPNPQPPGNSKPVAHAGGPYAGEAGSTLIQFDGSASSDADGDQLNFAWSFGDGATDIGMMPTHTYTMTGNFEVSLVVNDGAVNSDPDLTTAAITAPPVNLAPSADAGGPYEGRPGQPVVFDASASADPNGDALSYAWQFGDGATGTGVAPTHTYAADGTYVVSLTVNDGELDSAVATSSVTITTPVVQTDGEALYNANCLGCHGDPWAGSAVDAALAGQRRVAGARSCNLTGSIFGTSVFPNGVPEMQFLQGLANEEIDEIANYLNSQVTSGERRYITTCAGCHGNDGSGGRVGEDVYGDSAGETWEAIAEESEMNYMACMPRSDINDIVDFLKASSSGADDDDDEDDDEGGGSTDLPLLVLLAGVALLGRIGRQLRRAPAS